MKSTSKKTKKLTKSIENNRDKIIEIMMDATYNALLTDFMDYHVVLDLNDDLEINNVFLQETKENDNHKVYTIYSLKCSEQIGDYLKEKIKENEEYETIEDYIYSKQYADVLNDILDGVINGIKKDGLRWFLPTYL